MSLIEVMVSLIILGMVVYPLLDLFRQSSALTATALDEVAALHLAQEIMEEVKSIPANQMGTAQRVAHDTVTLEDRASDADNAYRQQLVAITGGPGAGQVRQITGYDGGRRQATVDRVWDGPAPVNNDSSYLILDTFDPRYDFRIKVIPGDAINLKTVQVTVSYSVNGQGRDISLTTEKLTR